METELRTTLQSSKDVLTKGQSGNFRDLRIIVVIITIDVVVVIVIILKWRFCKGIFVLTASVYTYRCHQITFESVKKLHHRLE